MRLIDADELQGLARTVVGQDNKTHTAYFKTTIDDAPTVEAIPIEWIKKYLHKLEIISKDNLDLGEDGYFGDVVAIENMLYAWEKENETNRQR